MKEILRTNDPIRFSYAESILGDEGIETFNLDRHLATMGGRRCNSSQADGGRRRR